MGGARGRAYTIDGVIRYSVVSAAVNPTHPVGVLDKQPHHDGANRTKRSLLWRWGRGGVDDGDENSGYGCVEVRVVVAVIRVAAKKSRWKDGEAPEKVYRTAATPRAKHDPVLRDSDRKCGYHESVRHALCGKCRVREIDLLPIHGWVTQRNLSTRMGRDQQLPPGYPERIPRCCRSYSAVGDSSKEEEIKKLDQEIQGLQNQTSDLKTLLEAETDMKKAAETKNADLTKELESLLIASRRWVIGHGLRLAVLKCGESTKLRQVFADVVSAGIAKAMSEGLKYVVEHGKANLNLEAIEAYDPEAETQYVAALHALRDLKYPMVDHLELLKDAPIDVVMASFHLESDYGEVAPQWIRELRPSSSQLKIPVYPEKKKCRVVCRTHRVGSAHHARSDGVPVSVPTVSPQGLAILLADDATQTKTSKDGASPRICTCGVLCAPWESSRMHLMS
nr:hypothetical protein [Tanacetum cinerariifolium]